MQLTAHLASLCYCLPCCLMKPKYSNLNKVLYLHICKLVRHEIFVDEPDFLSSILTVIDCFILMHAYRLICKRTFLFVSHCMVSFLLFTYATWRWGLTCAECSSQLRLGTCLCIDLLFCNLSWKELKPGDLDFFK